MSDDSLSLSQRTAIVAEQRFVERLAEIEADIGAARDGAISWTFQGIRRMHDAGALLCEAQQLLRGDYTDWFRSNAGRIGFSPRTGDSYKRVHREIERLGGFVSACEKFPDRHDFLIALGVLKPREAGEPAQARPQPVFQLRFKIAGPPVEEWPMEQCRDFLAETEPLLSIRERARARLEAA